jgi:ubiquinone/menaquinone biosynthesis C-methylase UbiE
MIYTSRAAAYQRMIAAEDVEGNLLPALLAAAPLAEKRLLDVGGGTGRIPTLTHMLGAHVVSIDLHRPMLREQRVQRERLGGGWPLLQGDMRRLPFASAGFDGVIAGWSIGHLVGWHPHDWRTPIGQVLHEMLRVARPEGALVILETLGTGALSPAPPHAGLAAYYAWLEQAWGFKRQVIQTDYQFASVEEAVACTHFFFGGELAAEIRRNQWARVPEWTGLWSRTRSDPHDLPAV